MKEEGFDTKFKAPSGEDPEFSFRLAEKRYKMIFNPNAIVYHEHPRSIIGYLRQKFNRGYWRVRLYRKHPRKIAGESYTPFRVLIQIPLSILLFLGLFLVPFFGFALFTISLAFLLSINLIEGIKMYKFERKMAILAPIILSLRSIFSTLGAISGFVNRLYSLQ
jgi:cellulose synthase/poly-beta-1,6-N-acetylglucosamine synthase-like glycosyltransferase